MASKAVTSRNKQLGPISSRLEQDFKHAIQGTGQESSSPRQHSRVKVHRFLHHERQPNTGGFIAATGTTSNSYLAGPLQLP